LKLAIAHRPINEANGERDLPMHASAPLGEQFLARFSLHGVSAFFRLSNTKTDILAAPKNPYGPSTRALRLAPFDMVAQQLQPFLASRQTVS